VAPQSSSPGGAPEGHLIVDRTVVHLLRHGEVYNPEKVLYGRLPGFHLSDLGRQMADRAAAALAGRDLTTVISSPMERAQETATPIAESHGLPIEIQPLVIEADNVFEGQRVSVGDGVLRQPGTWKHLYNPFRPSWGEPYDEVADRMHAAMDEAREAARGHEAVIVSHQLPIWIARLRAENRRLWHDPRSRQCGLASLTSFTYDGDDLVAIEYTEPSRDLLARASKIAGA
jgi:broad specificity phosphatase PhoE